MTGKGNRNEDRITVCADGARTGDDIEIEIEFEAIPKPDKVEWIMQESVGRNSETLDVSRRDERRGNYEAFEIEEDRDIDNRYIARIKIDKLDDDDLEEDNHLLYIENDEGDQEFLITIDTSRNCKATQNVDQGDEGFCSDSSSSSTKSDEVADKAKEILIDSCLKMSSPLLDVYTPEGKKKDNDNYTEFCLLSSLHMQR